MSLLIFLLVLSVLILVHEFGHFYVARKIGVRVERFALGFGPKLFSVKKGDTEYAVCAVPLGGYVKMAGDERSNLKNSRDEYYSQTPFNRFKIVFAGAFLNYVFAFLLFYLVFLFGYPTMTTKVGGLLDGFPAKNSGIQIGDKIVSIDKVRVINWEEMTSIIRSKKEGSVDLVVFRNNQEINLKLATRSKEVKNIFGQTERIGLIGIIPAGEVVNVKHGALESFGLAWEKQIQLTTMTYKSLWFMLTGMMSFKETVSGPLGIFYVTKQAASFGILALMHVMAVISLSLAIFNLLPLPILDGGHIFLTFIETIRKKPLNIKVENVLNQTGMALLLLLVVFVSFNDLQKFGFLDKVLKIFR